MLRRRLPAHPSQFAAHQKQHGGEQHHRKPRDIQRAVAPQPSGKRIHDGFGLRVGGRRIPEMIAKVEQVPFHPRPTQVDDGIFGINLYRANFLKSLLSPRERHTHRPVQLIVAEHDNYVGPQLFEDMTRWVPDLWRRDVEAGHWGLIAQTEKLAGWIADFITQTETGKEAPGLQKVTA